MSVPFCSKPTNVHRSVDQRAHARLDPGDTRFARFLAANEKVIVRTESRSVCGPHEKARRSHTPARSPLQRCEYF